MPNRVITTKATAKLDDPVTFTLAGLKLDRTPWAETFTAVPVLTAPAIESLGLAAVRATADDATDLEGLNLIRQFMETALLDEDYARFAAIMGDRNYLLDVDDIRECIQWIVEEVTGRPLAGPSTSPSGASATASTSVAAPSPPATIQLPSLPGKGRTGSTSRSRSTSTGSRKR